MKPCLRVVSLLLLLELFCGCQTTVREPISVSGVAFVMDTWVEQRWYGEEAQETYDEILTMLTELENRLSLYRDGSEIALLNAAAGKEPVKVSADTFALLKRAVELSEESGGLFDITIAPLTLAWDITGENPCVPPKEKIFAAQALVSYRGLLLDESAQTAMLARMGMQVDLGGIAKGMAASAARSIPEHHQASGYLSIGGNMMVRGKKPDKSEFIIGVRDPRGDANELLGTVTLDGLTMATTGDYERYFELDGVRYHHVFDPFTGYPSTSDLISVTVISADGTLADCLSTSVFLQGSQGLSHYLDREDCQIMAVTKDREVYASSDFWQRFTINPQKKDYIFHRK